jgi:hypothetical protein
MEIQHMPSIELRDVPGHIRKIALALAAVLLLTACDGDDGDDGAAGADGLNSLTNTVEIPVGDEQCPGGGLVLESGLDANRNGLLDSDEIQSTSTISCETSSVAFTLSSPLRRSTSWRVAGTNIPTAAPRSPTSA